MYYGMSSLFSYYALTITPEYIHSSTLGLFVCMFVWTCSRTTYITYLRGICSRYGVTLLRFRLSSA